MIALLAAVLLVSSPCLACEAGSDSNQYCDIADLDGDANIYHAAVFAWKLMSSQLDENLFTQLTQNVIQHIINDASSVCYDDLGCFDKYGTFKHLPLKMLPEPPEFIKTQFLLYTRRNRDTPQFLDHLKPETVLKSHLDKTKPLKFLAHGFTEDNNMTWLMNLRNAFLDTEDVNIIVIDWKHGARGPFYNYFQAAVNSELVGAQGAALYYFIKENMGIMEKDLHLIGFSMGAHVVGFFGKRLFELRGTKPGRITGLDPASPLFEKYGDEVHLSKNDGEFVDVVHSNGERSIHKGVGIKLPIGHADYFPNGGKRQPGCESGKAFNDKFKIQEEVKCNHARAVDLFIESILDPTPCRFISYPCNTYSDFKKGKCMQSGDSCGQMGYKSKGRGNCYLMTKAKSPFCAEHAKITARFAADTKESYGSIIFTLTGENGKKEVFTLTRKDKKLSPGDEKVLIVPINHVLMTLRSVETLYLRYNGKSAKGSKKFALASVTIKDTHETYIFKSCEKVTLKHEKYFTLKPTEAAC